MANRTGLFGTEKYPECPLVNHSNCRELHSPKLCAIVRKDKTCLRRIIRRRKKVKYISA
jgi:hypothetical protein